MSRFWPFQILQRLRLGVSRQGLQTTLWEACRYLKPGDFGIWELDLDRLGAEMEPAPTAEISYGLSVTPSPQ